MLKSGQTQRLFSALFYLPQDVTRRTSSAKSPGQYTTNALQKAKVFVFCALRIVLKLLQQARSCYHQYLKQTIFTVDIHRITIFLPLSFICSLNCVMYHSAMNLQAKKYMNIQYRFTSHLHCQEVHQKCHFSNCSTINTEEPLQTQKTSIPSQCSPQATNVFH